LPASFYKTAKPAWWGSLNYPAIGPDVTSGGSGGHTHADLIPAQNCYLNIMGGVEGGPGSPLGFNPNNCYALTPTVTNPAISPASGGYISPQTITVTCPAGATCGYTSDGSTPTASSGTITHGTTYSAPFSQAIPATVKAIGSQSGLANSGVVTNTYTAIGVPAITSPLVIYCPVNLTTCSYQITATNSPSSFSASGLPSGLSVNTSTGIISGTPISVGSFSTSLGATNGSGTGTATLSLNIGYFVHSSGATGASVSLIPFRIGDGIYAMVFCGFSSACPIVVTSAGESWSTPIYTALATNGAHLGISCGIATSTLADTVQATGNGSSGNIAWIQLIESSGTGCPLDTGSTPSGGYVVSNSTMTSPVNSASITTATANDFMIFYAGNSTGLPSGSDVWSEGSSFFDLNCTDNSGFNPGCTTSTIGLRTGVEDKTQASPGAVSASFTSTAAISKEWGTILAAYKPSGTLPAPPTGLTAIAF
jgi:hypothetical protein